MVSSQVRRYPAPMFPTLLFPAIFAISMLPSSDTIAGKSFSIDKLKVPPYVILGQTVHLNCLFSLQNGTDIYTLKWFKDGREFYRSVPRAEVRQNRRIIYPMAGIKVDFENSKIISPGIHQLALLSVTLETTGLYTCQITMDSPPFEFLELGDHLTVISLPERFPVISGHRGQDYRLGDWVHLNCTCYDSYPAATLKWFVNGNEVDDSYLIRYLPTKSLEEEGLETATLGISFEVTGVHFATTVHPDKRELWVRCEATMPPIDGMTFPFTREVFLGTFSQSFDRYHSKSVGSNCSFGVILLTVIVNYIFKILSTLNLAEHL